MEILKVFFTSAAFVAALIGFINTVQRWLFPDVPNEVMLAFNALTTAVVAVIGTYLASQKVKAARLNA